MALEQPDFFAKLNSIQKSRISARNYAEISSSVYLMNLEKGETADLFFKKQLEAKKAFEVEWKKYSDASPSFKHSFAALKQTFTDMAANSEEVYIQTYQIRTYWESVGKSMGDALEMAYKDPEGIREDDRKELVAMAQQVAKINEMLSRMAKKYDKKPDNPQA